MAFNQAEFNATLERVARGEDHGQENPQPGFDARLHRDVRADAVRGRKIEDYRTALEAQGFEYCPVEAMLPWEDGTPKTDAEWRSRRLRLAFTETDILTMFRGPEDFFVWCEKQKLMRRAAKSGLVIPPSR